MKKIVAYSALLIISGLFIAALLNGQQQPFFSPLVNFLQTKLNLYNQILPNEKVYVQLDRTMYKPGDDIWLSLWVTDGVTNKPSSVSEIVNVDLISPSGQIATSHRVFVINGRAECDFKLDETCVGGIYTVKAYTNWMLNFEKSNSFEKQIIVQKAVLPRLLMKLDMQREAYGAGDSVVANLDLKDLTNKPLAYFKFTYQVSLNGMPYATQTGTTDSEGKANVVAQLPDTLSTSDGILNILVNYNYNNESISRSIPIVLNKIDLQFMPEGGDLIANQTNNVAFKALNEFGKPADVEGVIFNKSHQQVCTFKSYHHGMGAAKFVPQAGQRYYALLNRPDGIMKLYELPVVLKTGYLLSVPDPMAFMHPNKDAKAVLRVIAPADTSVSIIGQVAGKIYFSSTLKVFEGDNLIEVPLQPFPAGVAQFTLFTQGNVAACERLVFVKKNQQLKIELTTDKQKYGLRDEVTLKVKASTPDGKPVATTLGISVADNKQLTFADDKSDNILSYLLLSSELKGDIEEPNFYFDPQEAKADTAIDYLLLTQGWRRFSWKELARSTPDTLRQYIYHQPEKRIFTGVIYNSKIDFTKSHVVVKETGQKTTPDKYGYFEFRDLDLREPATLVVVTATNDSIPYQEGDYNCDPLVKAQNALHQHSIENKPIGSNTFGLVLDNNYHPLKNCEITLKEDSVEVKTDKDGYFQIKAKVNQTIKISRVGYITQDCTLDEQNELLIVLDQDFYKRTETITEGQKHIINKPIKKTKITKKQEEDEARVVELANLELREFTKSDEIVREMAPPPPPVRNTVQFTVPVIKPDEEEDLKSQKDLQNSTTSIGTIAFDEGTDDEDIEVATSSNIIDNEPEGGFLICEQMPEFPGGNSNLLRYLSYYLRYPHDAIANGIQGTVYLRFVIDANGFIDNVLVVRSLSKSCDAEAVRVVSTMPQWTPGKQGGISIRVAYTLPIKFTLTNNGIFDRLEKPKPYKGPKPFLIPRYTIKRGEYYKARVFYTPKYQKHNTSADRTDFRKTIYWNPALGTDENGYAEAKFITTDEVTSFRITAEGIGNHGEIGRSEQVFGTVKPLTVDVKLPEYLLGGDTLSVPINVSNATNDATTANLSIEWPKSLKRLNTLPVSIALPANTTKTVYAEVVVDYLYGKETLKVTIASNSHKDAVSTTFNVASPGFPVKTSYSGSANNKTFDVTMPKMVANSLKAEVVAYPDVLASLNTAIKSMLAAPHGCFEQVSSSTYPNIMALQYLKRTGIADEETSQRAMTYIKDGYAMLVKYETSTQGFEWFGASPGHEGLTAFGLMEFMDMKTVYPGVDNAMVERNKKWLMSRRDGKGGFATTHGKYGFSTDGDKLNNAYLVYALSEIGEKSIAAEFEKAYNDNINSGDAYRMALVANAALNRNDYGKANELLSKLTTTIESSGFEALKPETSITGSGGKSLQIETVSLIALALLKQPNHNKALLEQIINYIILSRQFGGYGSTQSTVLALKAMVGYSNLYPQGSNSGGEMHVSVDGVKVGSVTYNVTNLKSTTVNNFEKSFGTKGGRVSVSFSGSAIVPPYNLNTSYYQLEPISHPDCPLTFSTVYQQKAVAVGENVRLSIDIKNTKNHTHSMVTAIVTIPSGLSFQPWQLKELQEKKVFDYYEMVENKIYLYYRLFLPNEVRNINLDLKAEVPGKYRGAASCVYLYYYPEHTAWTIGGDVEVKKVMVY